MSQPEIYQSLQNRFPGEGNLFWGRGRNNKKRTLPGSNRDEAISHPALLPYPIDMALLVDTPWNTTDEAGVLCSNTTIYDPKKIAQYALIHWNNYLAYGVNESREIFMIQANWLLTHKFLLSNGAYGWPGSFPSNAQDFSSSYLSAVTQSMAISVLLRAYQLNGSDTFLQAASQSMHTFELDILDGGVGAPVGDEGIFFEDTAIYPAAHVLHAHILALLGLYDYLSFVKNNGIEALIKRANKTLHGMLDEFDTGYWTYYDFFHNSLASRTCHCAHIALLKSLGGYSGCEHCSRLAEQWTGYHRSAGCLLRYFVADRMRACYYFLLKSGLQRLIAHPRNSCRQDTSDRVCVPITAFPVAGGMRSVLAGVAQVMGDRWKMVYLTCHKGQKTGGLTIEQFGWKITSCWRFPSVWFYCMTGGSKLLALLRQEPGFDLILPQDGVFTAAFAALIGKLAGVRVVCMDHGNVTLLNSSSLKDEEKIYMKKYSWYHQLIIRLQSPFYRGSLRFFARIATSCADQFLVAGDEVETVYRDKFGVHPARIIRYPYMVDIDRFILLEKEARVKIRTEYSIPGDALIITLINRLAAEKGLHLAIEAIAQALASLPAEVCRRVKVLIVGDGPLRLQIQADIKQHNLEHVCKLWGEADPPEVERILAISDIFLYCGTRGTNYSMAVLEAMAAGCAVIASNTPLSNERLLANRRGIAVPIGNVEQMIEALIVLLNDLELCHEMGLSARNYVASYHSAAIIRRSLLRVSHWSSLNQFLEIENEIKGVKAPR